MKREVLLKLWGALTFSGSLVCPSGENSAFFRFSCAGHLLKDRDVHFCLFYLWRKLYDKQRSVIFGQAQIC